MTAELTPDDLAAMRERHQLCNECDGLHCSCHDPWPCDAVRLLDEVERLRGMAYKRAGQWMASAGQREAPSVSDGDRE